MKFLKPILSTILFFTALGLYAQQAPKKETVIIGKFVAGNSVGETRTHSIRQGVLNGFFNKGRLNVIDAATNAELQKMNADRGSEDIVDANNILSESSSAVFKSLGANYLVSGNTTNYTCTQETKTVDGKTSKQYTTKITFALVGYNIVEGTVISSQEIELYGIGNTQGEADLSALKDASKKMSGYINTNFTFETYILELAASKKGKLKELYIHCGNDIGVQKGDLFIIVQETYIGGVKTTKEVARLRAIEVNEVTKCVITKGNDIIETVYNEGDPKTFTVISAGESFGTGILKGNGFQLF